MHYFLHLEGFTHIRLRGIQRAGRFDNSGEDGDNYILVPLKGALNDYEEANFQMEEMNSNEVKEMFDNPDGIHFMVELPEDLVVLFRHGSK